MVSGDVDLPVVDDAIMNEVREPSAMHSVDTLTIASTAPASTDTNHQDIAVSEALRPDTLFGILKDCVPGFPQTIAYQPPMNRNTSPAKVLLGEKKFSFALFLLPKACTQTDRMTLTAEVTTSVNQEKPPVALQLRTLPS